MNKQRQVVFSKKGKSQSDHIPPKQSKPKACKKHHCQGIQKQATSRFHSEGKSQKPTKRKIAKQKSQSKLITLKVSEQLGDLKNQLSTLQSKYQSKSKQLKSLKQLLKNYQHQIDQQNKLIKQFNRKSNQPNKNLLNQAQGLTRQAVNKYKVLNEQFQSYKQQTSIRMKQQKLKHQASILKLRQEYENKINRMQNSVSKQKEVFKYKQQQILNQTDLKFYKDENKKLRQQNQQLLNRIEDEQQQFRRKQSQFKSNLIKITQRVQNWEQQDQKIRIMQDQNQQLKYKYSLLVDKYQKRKSRQQNKTKEWAILFQQFLTQINKLKRQIQLQGDWNTNRRSQINVQ